MANIVLKTYAAGDDGQGTVTPQDDALIYQNAVPMNGLFSGGTVTLAESNVLHVASGFGVIGGRFFEINDCDISVELSSAGTLLGRVYVHLELTNADVPISIAIATGATLPALEGDANLNITNGNFDLELATFNVSEVTISDIVNTFPTIDNTSRQIRRKTAYAVHDFVLCQSANDALIFVCTTAGTTAVQEPTDYTSVANGSSVTDGTAVFKAYDLYSWIEGKAPKSHASTGTTYGIGTPTKYGHCKTINGLTQSSHVDGTALSAYQGKVLNDKISKTEDLIAYVQTSLTASKAYAVGEQFVYNGLLYKATAAIAQGGTITINGNCTLADSVTEQINGLNNDLIGFFDTTHITDLNTTSYVATVNCWARVYLASSNNSECRVSIDGVNVVTIVPATSQTVRWSIPVKAGQTIAVTGNNSKVQTIIPFL